jgi:anti-sigma regulatory factor (Ser/Thr protein kinase)
MTANRYLDKLVERGALEASGTTRGRKYVLKPLIEDGFEFQVPELEEHMVWRQKIAPLLKDESKNVIELFEYGVQEMVNNVIEHSRSETCNIYFRKTAAEIQIIVRDFGVGIFKKIAEECRLSDQREAILELAKGKMTTDPSHHAGEGVFFTSRMFTDFSIHAGHLNFLHQIDHDGHHDDWLIETEMENRVRVGTGVILRLDPSVKHTTQDIFAKFDEDDDGARRFVRTHVPVRLAQYGNEQLVSRSQARRVLSRFNRFSEVMLDFKGVPSIGQAFADEIFRVFKDEHPEIEVLAARTSPQVRKMIEHARSGTSDELPLFAKQQAS